VGLPNYGGCEVLLAANVVLPMCAGMKRCREGTNDHVPRPHIATGITPPSKRSHYSGYLLFRQPLFSGNFLFALLSDPQPVRECPFRFRSPIGLHLLPVAYSVFHVDPMR
jgi:hypothetical protein